MSKLRFTTFIMFCFFLVFLIASASVMASPAAVTPEEDQLIYIYSDTCPVCQQATPEAKAFAESTGLEWVPIDAQNPENSVLLEEIWSAYDLTHRVVPTFIVGDAVMQGFDDRKEDPFAPLLDGADDAPAGETCSENEETGASLCDGSIPDNEQSNDQNLLALTGTTLTIGLTDGVNP